MKKKTLVIVESPTKAKTIEKYLGNRKYTVLASMGHLRDLPKSQFGIDVENNFTPKYINIRGKGDLIKSLKKEAKKSDKIYLASDPDREGEAIAWHLAYILGIDEHEKCRIVFNEITKPTIQEAVKNPAQIDIDKVDAQQARRMLDRIVGYKLSPLLWKKIRKGLSAGRVQSVTVRMICDREKEIQQFKSEEYWTVDFKFRKKPRSGMFAAELIAINDEKLMVSAKKEKIKIESKTEADLLCSDIEKIDFKVTEIKKRQRQRKAPAPFTTSSLQQDAARKLGFTSRKTMMVAQQLYEGISLGRKGPTGLITYMRTDSTRISEIALNEARSYINENFGEKYLPEKPYVYSAGKSAQDAHEAIRPTNIALSPASVEEYLSKEQLKLYKLIWQRFLGCQMLPAVYDVMSVTIQGGKYTAKANGSKLNFAGFTAVYNDSDNKKEKDVILPDLQEGDALSIAKLESDQHFTEPPARYNDASLVKILEEKGIGRPSTYAPIIETILARGYVVRSDKRFKPTDLGFVVVDLLEKYFKDIVDEKFTAALESKLDEIAVGKIEKNTLLEEFYVPFEKTLEHAEEEIGEVEVPDEVSDVKCELCGRMMVIKQGRYGKFLACPGFPECRNTKPIIKDTGVTCPKCGGKIIERRTRRGVVFYGCENYPKCDYVSWDMPLTSTCKECGSFLFRHRFKNGRTILYCSNDDCTTRKEDTPINKEINKLKEKAAKAAAAKLQEMQEKAKQDKKDEENQ